MTRASDRPSVPRRLAPALAVVLATLLAGCASDQPVRPERMTPEGVSDVRAELAAQKAETSAALDRVMGGDGPLVADDGSPWYTPFFDALDFAASLGGLLR